ncbi:MAG: ABC transporter substrate-binding protein [Anaerolineae bacterium]
MQKTLRSILMIGVLVLATAVAFAQDDEMVVRIGAIHPLTGSLANDGQGMDLAIQMAADQINESGMLGDMVLEILSADSTGSAEVGQEEAVRLIEEEGVSALIGTFQSAVTANVATVSAREGVPLMVSVAAATSITEQGRDADGNQWTFRIQPNALVMGTFAAQYVREMAEAYDISVDSVGFMYEGATDYGRSVFSAFADEAEAQEIAIDEEIAYDFGVEYTTDITLLSASALDAVMVTGYYGDGLTIAETMQDVLLDTQFVMGVAQGTYDQDQFVADADELAECFFNSNYRWDNLNELALETRAEYEERYEEPMTAADVLAWQSVYVIADAIMRAESADPADIQAALIETEYEDHILPYDGPITFEDGETANAVPVVMQVQDGAVVQVWPEEIAEAEPRFCTAWD